jgi:pimeloyl-[acyl-carrier protein] methyl ester esterase
MTAPLHLESRGAGTPVALLHGWGMNLRVFDGLAGALAAKHRVLAVDLPGHGRSAFDAAHAGFDAQATDVAALLPDRCVVVGWSLGGQYALEFARRAPERVRGLVLLASTPRFVAGAGWEAGLKPALLQAFAEQLARDWHATLEEFLALQTRGSRESAAVLAELHHALRAHGEPLPEALVAGLAHLQTNDLRAAVPAIDTPALVIAGQHDRVTPPAAAEWLAATLPRADLTVLPRAGHAPFLSHADDTHALLGHFLADLPP